MTALHGSEWYKDQVGNTRRRIDRIDEAIGSDACLLVFNAGMIGVVPTPDVEPETLPPEIIDGEIAQTEFAISETPPSTELP